MNPETLDDVRRKIEPLLTDESRTWLDEAIDKISLSAKEIQTLFPAAGRKVGRTNLGSWTLDDAARAILLGALHGDIDEIKDLYRYGDTAERRAILRSLHLLPIGDRGMSFVHDALRTNDARLVEAALGPYALTRLSDKQLQQAVVKCVFMGIPLASLEGLDARVTPELSRMLGGFIQERVAAGRAISADLWPIVDKYPPAAELAAIEAELQSTIEERSAAAQAALDLRKRA